MIDKNCINIQSLSPIMPVTSPFQGTVVSDPAALPLPLPAGAQAPHRRLRVGGHVHCPAASPQGTARVEGALSAPLTLPGVWRADACAQPSGSWTTGHAALDAQLPGGGWPAGGLVELLCAQPGLYEGALLSPHWARITQAQPAARLAWVMLGRSPWRLHAPGVAHLGLSPQRLLSLQPATEADAAWAVEQMLHNSGICGVWWLTRHAQAQHLRRLQWAAQAAGIPLFVSRPLACRQDPLPAPLRLHLQAGPDQALRVHILKRQGPRLEQPIELRSAQPLHLLPKPHQPAQPPHHVVDRPVPSPVAA